jgi:hypothetical protein
MDICSLARVGVYIHATKKCAGEGLSDPLAVAEGAVALELFISIVTLLVEGPDTLILATTKIGVGGLVADIVKLGSFGFHHVVASPADRDIKLSNGTLKDAVPVEEKLAVRRTINH